ncbi:MAG: type ISP restriction/modification enzyme [Planctomycetota bacterium]
MDPLESYFRDLHQIRGTGAAVPETSYYSALANLLNEVGKTLKPKVRCVLQLANRGAGNPDGGLFIANQFQKSGEADPMPGQLPERGIIEVKPTSNDAWITADGPQVSKYWGKYRLVLVTSYRDFVLLGSDAQGKPVKLETYRLANNESDFWVQTAHPRRAADTHRGRFVEYLKRVMLHAAPLATPEDVAWFLASYARDAKSRIEEVQLPALAAVRQALEEALGLKFEGEKGEHFFRSTLVQTLFYGVFSAWVLWHKENPSRQDRFDWKQAAWSLHVPMIRTLFEQVAAPTQLQPLGLVEPLEWAAAVLNRVRRGEFFSAFDQGSAVQYFYEPFLAQFDPELRKELGVWYTPPEIVEYMVARVDTVLREELDIDDGLADPRVYVLDPCCGTGAYLVEVLCRIAATLKAKGGDALVAQDLKRAVMERVFGFEILPAPFVVAHLQLGLLLQRLQAPLSHASSERVAVYLTNALTGWEPPKGPKQHLMFPELEDERDAAEDIKRDKPILVILGNPPYNAFAGVSPAEEEGLVEPYKERLNQPISTGGWGIKKFNLDDLYVRFFRLAERRIAEKTGKGVICYISNFSYLGDPSFVVLRQRFLDEFDALWFDSMNGDSRETGKLTPDGKPDPSVFSTERHSVGIRVGTAIGLMVRKARRTTKPTVRYRDFWGVTKRTDLLASLRVKRFNARYDSAKPAQENRYSFRPARVAPEYMAWPRVVDLCAVAPSNGLMEKRGGALIDINRDKLEERMKAYFDPRLDWEEYRALGYGLTNSQARFDPKVARKKVIAGEAFDPQRVLRYALRPFDVRWCYYTGIRPVWNEPRPSLWAQCWKGNRFLLTRFKASKDPEGTPFYVTPCLSDDHFLAPDAVAVPLQIKNGTRLDRQGQADLFDALGEEPVVDEPIANLSTRARSYLESIKVKDPDSDAEKAALLWMHALAIGYSPAYLADNTDGIRQDWPRIPLPDTKKALAASAALGRQVAALLDTETQVKGVTSGGIRTELKSIGLITKAGGGAIDPLAGELDLSVGWGHPSKGGVIMPGQGKVVERDYSRQEREAIHKGAAALGLTLEQALDQLGATTRDVFLNNKACWCNIPVRVWEYVIGGYQVIKKWLSYREHDILRRGLSMDEAREVTNMARRIAALLLLQPALDENYRAAKESAVKWSCCSES